MKPKLGLITLGHEIFDVAMAKGPQKETALKELAILDIDLVVIDGLAAKKEVVLQAASTFKKEDVDGILVYQPDYYAEELGCILAMELKEYPILVWGGYAPPGGFIPIGGLLAMTSNLSRLGKEYFYTIGEPTEESVKKSIMSFAKAAMAVKKLRRATIGVVGARNIGMLDTAYSEFHLRQIVPNIINLSGYELYKLYENADENKAKEVVEQVKTRVGKIEVGEKQLIDAAKSYLAMKAMVDKYSLDAITIREWTELGDSNFTMCLGSALLNEQGIITVCECELSGLITAMAMNYMTGKPFYLGEMAVGDLANDSMVLFHEGSSVFSMAPSPEDIVLTYSGVSIGAIYGRQEGVNVCFAIKPGKVSVAILAGRPIQDKLRMAITGGEVLKAPVPASGGAGLAHYKSDGCLEDMIDTWVKSGFGHHMVVIHDDFKTEMENICDMLGIQKVVI